MSADHTLPLLLKELRLPTIKYHWQSYAQKAQDKHWTYAHYLAELSELELVSREQSRIKRYTLQSKLPPGKTLDTFDFKQPTTLNAAQVQALAEDTAWVARAENLIFFGPSGVGKTHLAAAIGYAMVQRGSRVMFSSTGALVQKLQQARAEYKLSEAISRLARYPLLILDDIGYVKKDDAETSVLFELIADRYERGSLIITANQPFSDWDSIFPDSRMAVAAIDRLVHHATIINIEGLSYRTKNCQQINTGEAKS